MISISPKIGEFLINVTHLPDIDAALKKVLKEYIELKIADLKEKEKWFETKWDMQFKEFQQACKNKTIKTDVYAYNVEKDFWEWEGIETLLSYYLEIESRWM